MRTEVIFWEAKLARFLTMEHKKVGHDRGRRVRPPFFRGFSPLLSLRTPDRGYFYLMWDTCGIPVNSEPLKAPFYQCLRGLKDPSILVGAFEVRVPQILYL